MFQKDSVKVEVCKNIAEAYVKYVLLFAGCMFAKNVIVNNLVFHFVNCFSLPGPSWNQQVTLS